MSSAAPVEILLVEDNPGDVRLTQEAFGECRVLTRLHVVMDGDRAMDFLRRKGEYAAKPFPDLVLLDLNLPRKCGLEVLTEIKSDEALRRIPVVILSTSTSELDINKAYELSANCYITKPVDLDRFLTVVQQIEAFWMTIVKLPGAAPGGARAALAGLE